MKVPTPQKEPTTESEFWLLGDGYRDAGNAVLKQLRSGTYVGHAIQPCIFLYFRSVELVLKTVLVNQGVPHKEIVGKRLGHSISKLLDRVVGFLPLSQIGLDARAEKLLRDSSNDYSEKLFEYTSDTWRAPRPEDIKEVANHLCDKVRHFGKPWRH